MLLLIEPFSQLSLVWRAFFALLTAFGFSLATGGAFIRWLQHKQLGQFVRQEGPQSHLSKSGTPTMGGALILLALAGSTLLWADWRNEYIWIVLMVTLGFGAVGWVDDYRKIIQKNTRGLPARWKYFWQSLFGLTAAVYLYHIAQTPAESTLFIPFIGATLPLGLLYVPFVYVVIVGSSNAVNLTDGLDGLAIFPTLLVALALGIFAWVSGDASSAQVFHTPFVSGSAEVLIFCAALMGAGLGFLWFNAMPALMFMGDVGALALGGALGVLAVIVRQELILCVMSVVFVMETLSVMLQVGSFKLRGKRIFKMAPIHHHFELSGWPESRVVIRFWILSVVAVIVGLSSLIG